MQRDRALVTGSPRGGDDMTCESMLEHAVVHPIRHNFQLEDLTEAQAAGGKR